MQLSYKFVRRGDSRTFPHYIFVYKLNYEYSFKNNVDNFLNLIFKFEKKTRGIGLMRKRLLTQRDYQK